MGEVKETEATRHFMKNWERQFPLWYHKIPDSRFGAKTNDRAIDVVACRKGIFIGLEFKLIKKGISIPINHVRDNQILTLFQIEEACGLGYILILDYSKKEKVAYLIPPDKWCQECQVAQDVHKKKSVRLEQFKEYKFNYKRTGRQMNWDFSLLERRVSECR